MSSLRATNGDEFRMERSMLVATSMRRPDTDWKFVDVAEHEHRWYVEKVGPDGMHISAARYSPSESYILPTLTFVVDGTSCYPDGTEYSYGHHECAQCGEKVEPRYKADDCQQYVPGLMRLYVNDRLVDKDEFVRRMKVAYPDVDLSGLESER